MPPAFLNHRVPTACGTPTPTAASSLAVPAAIAAQNRRRSSRPATGGRPGENNRTRPERSERRFRMFIAAPVKVLRRPLESAMAPAARGRFSQRALAPVRDRLDRKARLEALRQRAAPVHRGGRARAAHRRRHARRDTRWTDQASRRCRELCPRERRFQQSPAERFDAIILATGFRPDLRALLPDAKGVLNATGAPLVSGRATAEPGLFFCGAIPSALGQFRQIGIEARRIADAAQARRRVRLFGSQNSRHNGRVVTSSS